MDPSRPSLPPKPEPNRNTRFDADSDFTHSSPSVRLSTCPSSSYGYSTCALQQVVPYRRRQRYNTRRATNNKVAQEQESRLSTGILAHQLAALQSAGRGSAEARANLQAVRALASSARRSCGSASVEREQSPSITYFGSLTCSLSIFGYRSSYSSIVCA